MGLLVSLYGLSGAIFSQMYDIFFAGTGDISGFLLTMGIILFAVDVLSAAVLRVVPPSTEVSFFLCPSCERSEGRARSHANYTR